MAKRPSDNGPSPTSPGKKQKKEKELLNKGRKRVWTGFKAKPSVEPSVDQQDLLQVDDAPESPTF
jgi:hypothetical protein